MRSTRVEDYSAGSRRKRSCRSQATRSRPIVAYTQPQCLHQHQLPMRRPPLLTGHLVRAVVDARGRLQTLHQPQLQLHRRWLLPQNQQQQPRNRPSPGMHLPQNSPRQQWYGLHRKHQPQSWPRSSQMMVHHRLCCRNLPHSSVHPPAPDVAAQHGRPRHPLLNASTSPWKAAPPSRQGQKRHQPQHSAMSSAAPAASNNLTPLLPTLPASRRSCRSRNQSPRQQAGSGSCSTQLLSTSCPRGLPPSALRGRRRGQQPAGRPPPRSVHCSPLVPIAHSLLPINPQQRLLRRATHVWCVQRWCASCHMPRQLPAAGPSRSPDTCSGDALLPCFRRTTAAQKLAAAAAAEGPLAPEAGTPTPDKAAASAAATQETGNLRRSARLRTTSAASSAQQTTAQRAARGKFAVSPQPLQQPASHTPLPAAAAAASSSPPEAAASPPSAASSQQEASTASRSTRRRKGAASGPEAPAPQPEDSAEPVNVLEQTPAAAAAPGESHAICHTAACVVHIQHVLVGGLVIRHPPPRLGRCCAALTCLAP
jgi:hypothetical protein